MVMARYHYIKESHIEAYDRDVLESLGDAGIKINFDYLKQQIASHNIADNKKVLNGFIEKNIVIDYTIPTAKTAPEQTACSAPPPKRHRTGK